MKQFLDSVFAISGIMKVYIYIYIYIYVCVCVCGIFSITSLPHSTFCICPAIVISSFMEEKQSMYRLSLKEKTLSLCVNV